MIILVVVQGVNKYDKSDPCNVVLIDPEFHSTASHWSLHPSGNDVMAQIVSKLIMTKIAGMPSGMV